MESIKRTAQFWSQFLKKSPPIDAGDLEINMMAAAVQELNEKPSVSEESVKIFESCIERIIAEELSNDPNVIFKIDVDYHPDITLKKALKEAGIKIGMTGLPWKTISWTSKDCVKVRQGYGAEIKTL